MSFFHRLISRIFKCTLSVAPFTLFPIFGDVQEIVESSDYLYYLSEGCLYSYNKSAGETRTYNGYGDLSSYPLDRIFYNYIGDYLLVAYLDGNLDLLYPDGSRKNMHDIKTAQIDYKKTINGVAFDGDDIYVATEFGIVVFSEKRREVRQSGVFGKSVRNIALTDSKIVITLNGDGRILILPKGERINRLESFIPQDTGLKNFTQLHTLDAGGETLLGLDEGQLYIIKLNGTDSPTVESIGGDAAVDNLIVTPGNGYFRSSNQLYSIDKSGFITTVCSMPDELLTSHLTTLRGPASVWAASAEGVGEYRIDGDKCTVLHDRYRPEYATSFGNICKLSPFPDNRTGFYATNLGMNQLHPMGLNEGYGIKLRADVVTPESISPLKARTRDGKAIENPTFVIGDPDDTSILYVGSASGAGVLVIKDGEEIGRLNMSNSTMLTNRPSDAVIDSEGNFWLAEFTADTSKPAVSILPSALRNADASTLRASDWIQPELGNYLLSKDVRILLCEESRIAAIFDSQYRGGLVGYDYGTHVDSTADDDYMIQNPLRDTDGKTFNPNFFYCGVVDRLGRLWIGTSEGVIEITNPADLLSPSLTVKHLKVPRNDGSGFADYLLGSEDVYAMTVDSSNRKWLGTKSSGLYLVSADGDKVISHYTTSNSLLPTNTITSIYVDPNSNMVYVGTLMGLLSFSSDSSPAMPDYSEVLAYPNPVNPDYAGTVTIRGLMEGSLVKIVDTSMRLVAELYSKGGMVQWDLIALGSGRAKSGVYYVLASTNPEINTAGAVVAKILVVN
ncbi:MAG: hypothetical protein NC453_03435 [Muribaculum sp.]|nr:hypothetical protein [Muribaculum sp.]